MTTSSALLAALAAFDDGALETLASKGLLRRARRDVEDGKVVVEARAEDSATVRADGEAVAIGPAGPAAASCTCPAAGVCRHRLAAVLALRAGVVGAERDAEHAAAPEGSRGSARRPRDPPRATRGASEDSPVTAAPVPTSTPTGTPRASTDGSADAPPDVPDAAQGGSSELPASEPAPDPLAELLAIPRGAFAKWAGRATLRAAEELLAQNAEAEVRTEGRTLVVTLGALPTVRYLAGQGLDGMISKASKARRKALHAAAALHVRRARGAEREREEAASEAPPARPDPRFLASVAACLADCLRTGFGQAPLALEERLFALSVSSRADALPRLSAMLRTLAARVRARRERDFTLDAEAYLELLAEAHALTRALAAIVSRDDEQASPGLDALQGVVQREYAELGDLELLGVGAERWHTAAGARGVTAHFYAPAERRWFSASIARGHGHDARFDPRVAYQGERLWGAAGLAELCRSRVTLSRAAAASDGRLSLARAVRAKVEPWEPLGDPVRPECIHDGWGELEAALRERFAWSLRRRTADRHPVLLAPAAQALPFLDELGQQIVWPVADGEGRWIGLTIDFGGALDEAAGVLERIARDERPRVVAALAAPAGGHFELQPFAVWVERRGPNIVNLTLDDADAGATPFRERMLRRIGRQAAAAIGLGASGFEWSLHRDGTARALDEAADTLLAVAELGGLRPGTSAAEAAERIATALDGLSLEPVARAMGRLAAATPRESAGRVLDATYLVGAARSMRRALPALARA